ncbi:hypothetical protein RRX38_05275 [Pseudomonas sp. DTU_2021_1001937_2_SI_NGA_ILE_001]|uniref:hypothetical protein n=1 Tax=Pseudomonas sp. DTU_2021_1001937_2_SI_NGA_ILE_001 TaxID=3077589 RepID=UPI0028FC2981|nr:hypothetical protein [Pseudomonas sp. DTU_2021_1001937_2_SI_NGA_ILE_001]WNW10588.1 hypothetical protein RRX38_05275 [Pseudomonas sp. DTU_2021_1001937_2_SI_NGA_ILE_001]
MSDISDVVRGESPRDVILFIVRGGRSIAYPMLDRLYCRHDWVNISNNLELLKLFDSMIAEGSIEYNEGGFRKGPEWKEPEFIKEKKYTFEQP